MTKVMLDKLQATSNGNIESVVGAVDLPNGSLVALGGLVAGEREKINAVAPADTKELLLVATSEIDYTGTKDELDYVTPAGKVGRAYHLTIGDKFQAEQSLFVATPVVGDVVTGNSSYKYVVNDGTTVNGRTTFEVEALTTIGFDARPAVLLRVLTV